MNVYAWMFPNDVTIVFKQVGTILRLPFTPTNPEPPFKSKLYIIRGSEVVRVNVDVLNKSNLE